MAIDQRQKHLRRMETRYRQPNRKGRRHPVDEMGAVTELHRSNSGISKSQLPDE